MKNSKYFAIQRTIVLILGILWLFHESGYVNIDIRWLAGIVIAVSLFWSIIHWNMARKNN